MSRQREFDTEATVGAAMRLFQQKGFDGTSMQDLVDATGVGRGSLYAAFGDKEGIYLAALDRYNEDFSTPLIELLHQGASVRDVLVKTMMSVVDSAIGDGTRHACLIVTSATQSIADDIAVSSRINAATGELEEALREVVSEGQRRGEISADRSPSDIARFLGSTTHGIRVSAAINPDRATLTTIAEMAVAAVL